MLQQILKDMYIAPELLAELDEEQKQTLFFKMRQEQIRRWKEREEKMIGEKISLAKKNSANSYGQKGTKRVDFLLGEDKNPWTWVMGEHPNDIPIQQIYEKYENIYDNQTGMLNTNKPDEGDEAEKTQILNRKALSKTESAPVKPAELTEIIKEPIPDCQRSEAVINRSNLDANQQVPAKPAYPKIAPKTPAVLNLSTNVQQPNAKTGLKPAGDATLSARSDKEPKDGVLRPKQCSLKETKQELFKRRPSMEEIKAEGREIFKHWAEQESKAKKMDEQRRLVAKRIREDNARLNRKLRTESQIIGAMCTLATTGTIDIDIEGSQSRPPKPSNMGEVVKWYLEEEKPKGSLFDSKSTQYSNFFHGTINRETAEERLTNEAEGSFLFRLSDKIWGYALSYKGAVKIRHYLVDAQHQGGYQFFGYNHPPHFTLQDFIDFYKVKPLSVMLPEKLLRPCIRHEDLILLDNV